MNRVILFARVSTLQQDLEPQVAAVKRAIISDGYDESEIIVVQGKESAIKLDEEQRQTINELKEIVSYYPNVECIYFFAVDRLARRMGVVINVVEWAVENNINLVFLNPHRMSIFRINEYGIKVQDDLTKLLLTMLSYGAEMEMKIKKARFASARESMRLQGKLAQGKPLKGYYLGADRTISINEAEAELIRGLYNDYLNGEYTLTTLHRKYAQKGLFEPCTNKSTIKVRIHNMLNNVSYSGRNESIQYPPIVSKELQEQIVSKMKSRVTQKKINTKHVHYAKGLLRCKVCNHLMRPQIGVCNYTCQETGEHTLSVNLNVADSIIWYNAAEWYKYYMKLDFNNTKDEYQKKLSEAEQSIMYIESLINQEMENQDRAFKKFYRGRVREDVYDEMVEESQKIVYKLNNDLSRLKLSVTEYQRLIDNVNNTKVLNPSELFSLNDYDKVEIIKKVVKVMYAERLDKFKYKISVHPTEMIEPLLNDVEYYIYYAMPNANRLEVHYYNTNEWKIKDITDIIIKRHERKKYGRH